MTRGSPQPRGGDHLSSSRLEFTKAGPLGASDFAQRVYQHRVSTESQDSDSDMYSYTLRDEINLKDISQSCSDLAINKLTG